MSNNQLYNPASNMHRLFGIGNRLNTILSIAKYITYGAMFTALMCVVSGTSCNINNLVEFMTNTHVHGKAALGATIIYPIGILCFALNYLIPFVYAYIFHAMDVSLDCVKKDFQLSSSMSSFLIWGNVLMGLWGIILELDDSGLLTWLAILFFIPLLVVEIIWVKKLYQKWSSLSSEHEKIAKLLKNYIYLFTAFFVVSVIGYMLDDTIGDVCGNIIAPCVDLYLFYKFGECFEGMRAACIRVLADEKAKLESGNK